MLVVVVAFFPVDAGNNNNNNDDADDADILHGLKFAPAPLAGGGDDVELTLISGDKI